MAEEKVGFGFKFGIEGHKDVEKGITEIIRAMGTSGSAAEGAAKSLSSVFKMVEFGSRLGGPLAQLAVAGALFAYNADKAGEAYRRLDIDLNRLTHVPVAGMSNDELEQNKNELLSHYKDLGLEAGNQFTASFADRWTNFSRGAKATAWDMFASTANTFGAKLPSAAQMSREANRTQNQVDMANKQEGDRLFQDTEFQKSMSEAGRKAATDKNILFNRGVGPGGAMRQAPTDARQTQIQTILRDQVFSEWKLPPDAFKGTNSIGMGRGILPESFEGQNRLRDIAEDKAVAQIKALQKRSDFEQKAYDAAKAAPAPLNPTTNLPDENAKAASLKQKYGEIAEMLQQQLDLGSSILDIEQNRRDAARDFMRAQNWGSLRSLGEGGRSPTDSFIPKGQGLNAASAALMGSHGRNRATGGTGINRDVLGGFGHDVNSHVSAYARGGISGIQALQELNRHMQAQAEAQTTTARHIEKATAPVLRQ